MNEHREPPAAVPEPGDEMRLLSALVDDELSAAERAELEARLADDPAAVERVAHYRAQNAALKSLFPVPADAPTLFVRRTVPWWRRASVAAGWLVAGISIGMAVDWAPRHVGSAPDSPQPVFAQRAAVAYAVYAPEQRHPVEVAAAEEAHLIKWLSKRLNRSLSIPSLQQYGYTLVGGRLLPGESGPAAQFMYQNEVGERLTLYVTSFPKEETSFRLLKDGAQRTFYWVNQGMGYAMSGKVDEASLRTMAVHVCNALGGSQTGW